jgi:hypothetical protein
VAATFSWSITNNPGTTVVDLGVSGQLWAFKNNDSSGTANYSTFPITAGSNSYDVYLRCKFTGAYNSIANLLFWMASTSPITNTTLYGTQAASNAFAAPATATNACAANVIPTGSAAGIPVPVTGLTASATAYSGYIIMQLRTGASAAAGDIATGGLAATAQYDES